MKRKAFYLVFDGLADWEAAHALPEIRKSGKFEVETVGLTGEAITTMGGVRVLPDKTLDQINPDEAAILILPGGDAWEEKPNEKVISLLRELNEKKVPIAAICGATLEVARAGLTRDTRHTSNALDYLKGFVTDYDDEAFYVNELVVTDKNLITASGLGSVEFAREIIRRLEIYNETDTKIWFDMFKHGIYAAEGDQ